MTNPLRIKTILLLPVVLKTSLLGQTAGPSGVRSMTRAVV